MSNAKDLEMSEGAPIVSSSDAVAYEVKSEERSVPGNQGAHRDRGERINPSSNIESYATELERIISNVRDRINRADQERWHQLVQHEVSRQRSAASAEILSSNPLRLAALGHHGAKRSSSRGIRETLLYMHYRFFLRRKDAKTIVELIYSGMFDYDYYLKNNPDVVKAKKDPLLHFLDYGARERRNPSRYFDVDYYLDRHPDVDVERENPLVHFLRFGLRDGYIPYQPDDLLTEIRWKLPNRPQPLGGMSESRAAATMRGQPGGATGAPKIVVYTAVAGGYDQLNPPGVTIPGVDFVVFRDDSTEVPGWEARPFNYYHQDPTRMARFVKLNPHVYFSEYDISIWIDANITITGDVTKFIDKLTDDDVVGIFLHPLRNCVYVEGKECLKRTKDSSEAIELQIEKYRSQGYPENNGLWETNIVVRRHNDARCRLLMREWWKEIEEGSRRDQLSLPVAVERTGVGIVPLGRRRENARDHHLVSLTNHPARRITGNSNPPRFIPRLLRTEAKSVVVGVCVHNALSDTKACLASLVAADRNYAKIVIVDDASDEETATFLSDFAKTNDNIQLIRSEENQGYTKSANAILKNGGDDWTILLNSDTIVGRRSIESLINCGEQFDNVGVIGPMSNAASWQSVPYLTGDDGKFCINKIPDGLGVDDMDEICRDIALGEAIFVPLVNGFCYAVRRAAIDTVGLFDEESFPMGYGEEDDFSLRVADSGLQCALALGAYVFHSKSATFTAERRIPLVAQGAAALRSKHSDERLKASVKSLRNHRRLEQFRHQFEMAQSKKLESLR